MKILRLLTVLSLLVVICCTPEAPLRNSPILPTPTLYGIRSSPDTNLYIFNIAEQQIVADSLFERLNLLQQPPVSALAGIGTWLFLQFENQQCAFVRIDPLQVDTVVSLPASPFIPVWLNQSTALLFSPNFPQLLSLDLSPLPSTTITIADTITLPVPPLRWITYQGTVFLILTDHILYHLRFNPFHLRPIDTLVYSPLFLAIHPLRSSLWIGTYHQNQLLLRSLRLPTLTPEYTFALPWQQDTTLLGAQITTNDFLYLLTDQAVWRIDLRSPREAIPILQTAISDVALWRDGSFSFISEQWYYHFDNRGQLRTSIPLPYRTQFFVEK